jgi:hypothetical protein
MADVHRPGFADVFAADLVGVNRDDVGPAAGRAGG